MVLLTSDSDYWGNQTNGLVFPIAGDHSKPFNGHVLLRDRSSESRCFLSGYITRYWLDGPHAWNFHLQPLFKEDGVKKDSYVSLCETTRVNVVDFHVSLLIGVNL